MLKWQVFKESRLSVQSVHFQSNTLYLGLAFFSLYVRQPNLLAYTDAYGDAVEIAKLRSLYWVSLLEVHIWLEATQHWVELTEEMIRSLPPKTEVEGRISERQWLGRYKLGEIYRREGKQSHPQIQFKSWSQEDDSQSNASKFLGPARSQSWDDMIFVHIPQNNPCHNHS